MIEFDKDTYVATESDGSVRIVVERHGSTQHATTFRWNLRSNSAEQGTDFAGIGPGTEQIPAGARTATLTIPLVSDAVVENTEVFLVEIEPVAVGRDARRALARGSDRRRRRLMNVRFSERTIRCRATSAELEQLLTGRAISLDLYLPRDRRFRINVRPSALETWQLESDPTGIWVSIPRAQLEAFGEDVAEQGRDRARL